MVVSGVCGPRVKVVRASFCCKTCNAPCMLCHVSPFGGLPELPASPIGFVLFRTPSVLSFAVIAVSNCDEFGPSDIEAPASWTSATVEAMVASWEELKRSPETFVAVAEADADTISPVAELDTVVKSVVTLTVETAPPLLS